MSETTPPTPTPSMVLTDAAKEQIKLRATFYNNSGVGVTIAGGLTLPVSIMAGGQMHLSLYALGGISVAGVASGFVLHLLGYRKLRSLK